MNKKLYLEVRRAIKRKDSEFVSRTIDNFPSLDKIEDNLERYYVLLIKGEFLRFKEEFQKTNSTLEEALSILPNISLDKIERASIYGRYAFSLCKLKEYNKALPYYSKAKKLTRSDEGRNHYYSLMVLKCLRELKKSEKFISEVKEVLNSLFTSSTSSIERKLEFIDNLTFTIKQSQFLPEIENFIQNLSITPEPTDMIFLKVYLLTNIAHASNNYSKLVQNKNMCMNSIPPKYPIPLKLQILSNLATMFKNPFGDFSTALALLEDALLLAGTNMPRWRAYILNSLGSILRFKGNYSRAIEFLNESVRISSQSSYTSPLGFAHNTLGMIYTLTGEYSKAQTHYKISLKLNSENNNLSGLGYTFGSMAWLESVQGNFSLANELYSKSIDSFKVNRHPPSIILLTKAIILSQLPSDQDFEIQELLTEAKNHIWKKKNLLDKGRYYVALGNINFNRNMLEQSEKDFIQAFQFTDTYEVKTQGLLGITKVRTDLFFQTNEYKHLSKVRELLSELKSIIQDEKTILGLEVELISAMLDMHEGDFQGAEDKINPLLQYTEENSLIKLHSQIKNQLQTLSIFKTQQRIENQVKGSNAFDDMKTQSIEDIINYLKDMTNLFHSYESRNEHKNDYSSDNPD